MSTEIATTEELATVGTDVSRAIDSLKSGVGILSTFTGTDFATRVQVASTITNAEALADHLDKTIMLRNVVIQPVNITDDKTGEITEQPRIILVDEDGSAYAAVSTGIFNSLKNFFSVIGQPQTWEASLPVKARKVKAKGAGHFFTLEVDTAAFAKSAK